jgi:hypothetical protein
MSRFVSDTDVKTIRAAWWGEDETVTIKKLTYGDRQKIAKQAVKLKAGSDGEFREAELGAANLVLLQVGIHSWTFTHPENPKKKCPVSRYWIERLTEEDADFILEAINGFNPGTKRTEDEQETFRGGDRDGDPDGESAAG